MAYVEIVCDNCSTCEEVEVDLFDSFPAEALSEAIDNMYWTRDVQVRYDCYDELCMSCTDDLRFCDWCEDGYEWEQDAYFCGDLCFAHHDCLIEAHNTWKEDNEEWIQGRECTDCGYLFPFRSIFGKEETAPQIKLKVSA